MIFVAEVLYKYINIRMLHKSCWPKTMRLKNVADTVPKCLERSHERRYLMGIVSVVVDYQVFFRVEVNIKSPVKAGKRGQYPGDNLEGNAYLGKEGYTWKGIGEIVLPGEREGVVYASQ